MSNFTLNPLTGQFDLVGGGSGLSIGTVVAGADIDSVLIVDGAGTLQDSGTMTDGQLIIGKTGSSPARALPSGTANQVIITPGSGTLTFGTPQDIATTSNVQFASVTTPIIDSNTTLTIGGTNATIINIGNSTSVLNFTGAVNNNNVTNLNVADKLFTVNSGGGVGSGSDSGFEIEENAVITGFFKTTATRDGFRFKAPATPEFDLSSASLTTTRVLTIPDASGIVILDTTIGNFAANTALSNLANPTSINRTLQPGITNSFNLGTSAAYWQQTFTGRVSQTTAQPYIQLGAAGTASLRAASANISIDWENRTLNDTSGTAILGYSGASLDALTHKIINVVDPTSPQDAATKSYIDTLSSGFANTTLSNLTSPIALNQNLRPDIDTNQDLGSTSFRFDTTYTRTVRSTNASPNISLVSGYLKDTGNNVTVSWNSRNLVDSTGNTTVDWQLKALVDGTGLTKLSWAATDIDINTRKIINVVNPTANQDAATKLYVDTGVGTAANKTLSNLTSPTAVNQSLIPGTDSTFDIGTTSSRWDHMYVNHIRNSPTSTEVSLSLGALLDTAGGFSLDWGSRVFYNGAGQLVLDYSATGIVSFERSDVEIRANAADTATSSLKFRELLANGNNFVAFKAPLAIGSNVTWTLPATDGTTGQVLSTNGSGILSFVNGGSPSDIPETSFAGANNVAAPADVTGFLFPNANVRSFNALVSVFVNATTSLYETFTLKGIQKGSTWEMSTDSTGDLSGVLFSITTGGQIQYTDSNYTGFSTLTMKFRAITTSV